MPGADVDSVPGVFVCGTFRPGVSWHTPGVSRCDKMAHRVCRKLPDAGSNGKEMGVFSGKTAAETKLARRLLLPEALL